MITTCRLTCDVHPRAPERYGWIVCQHVLDVRVPIAYLETPDKEQLGIMLCHACRIEFQTLGDLRLECPDCVDDLLRARELKP